MLEKENEQVRSEKSKVITAVLCLFFGWLGLHHFYAGRIGAGLHRLFTTLLLIFSVFADLIMILCGGFKDGHGAVIK